MVLFIIKKTNNVDNVTWLVEHVTVLLKWIATHVRLDFHNMNTVAKKHVVILIV